ncbi:glycosyltransferase family 9 protein [Alphaproteobacteria bacterium]|nr:glycosyltransferase family 9 protein [bacterium]MDC0147420.1 glycosyltransferase family 9 protein [Alphaproteobacteria bacterium]
MNVFAEKIDPSNILVIKLGALGDVIMAQGVMACIRKQFPKAHITLMTEPLYGRFMSASSDFDALLAFKRRSRLRFDIQRAIKKNLIASQFDMIIDLQNSPRSQQFQKWLSPAFISSTSSYATIPYRPDRSSNKSSRDYLAEQVAVSGIDISGGYLPDISWAGLDVSHILAAADLQDGFVLLVPGSAARHLEKRWPYFEALTHELASRGIVCVTAPGPDEMDLCNALPAHVLLDQGKPLGLNQLAGLGRHCGLVIGNDTGPTHLLAACKTRGIGLFGGHSPASNTGISEVYEVLEKPHIEDISIEEVLATFDRLYPNSV